MSRFRLLALIAALVASASPAAAQIQARTIELPKVIGTGIYTPLKPRTIALPEIVADGGFVVVAVKPRTIDLPKIFATGLYVPLQPRTIELKTITGLGVFVKISKTIQLPAYTASPPKGGRR